MTIKLGVIMDPIGSINYHKDSSLAMLLAAQKKGFELFYMEQTDLFLQDGIIWANVRPLQVYASSEHWFDLGECNVLELEYLDVILMRKDPPFDSEFLYTTMLLEQVEQKGTLVVNKPASLRNYNEKLCIGRFSQCCTNTLVSCNTERLKLFWKTHKDVIFKPLNGMGGNKIFKAGPEDPNVNVILETLTNFGKNQIMAQRFIPDIVNGDKRILLIDGEPIPFCLARIPKDGEIRGNLAAGASGISKELTDRDRWIAKEVGVFAKKQGLLFVGIDVIGDYLTEVNITSPTCIKEIDAQCELSIGDILIDKIIHYHKGML